MGSPGSRARCFRTCTGSPTAWGPVVPRDGGTSGVAFRLSPRRRHPRGSLFRGSIPGPHVPLSTLHPRPHGRRRMTRGRRESLALRRMTLSFTTPRRFIPALSAIKDMVTALEYRHVPTGTLAVLAQRLGTVWASPSTWCHLVRTFGWRRPRLCVHPAKPKVCVRTTRADEMWHIDTTVIRLLDGTKAYVYAVIDKFSRRILAWRVADTFAPVNSVTVLVEASRGATPIATTPVVLADAGVENVNAQVDDLITPGVLRRVLAFTELKFSNSMIEAWWRSLQTSMALPPLVRERDMMHSFGASEFQGAIARSRLLVGVLDGFVLQHSARPRLVGESMVRRRRPVSLATVSTGSDERPWWL